MSNDLSTKDKIQENLPDVSDEDDTRQMVEMVAEQLANCRQNFS